jgi:NAD(P)-dependent dehydrogenase (short-subunit alcohol dehydrogenase family)
MTSLFDLSNDVVVLTGGGGILGSRFADALASHGARLAILDRDGGKAHEVADEMTKRYGVAARGYEADVANIGDLEAMSHSIGKHFGQVTVLVNAVATKTQGFFEPFESYTLGDWHEVMRTNVTGIMLCCQRFGPLMAEAGQGSIINILSIYGIVAPDQRIYEGSWYEGQRINTPLVYSTSKAAVWGLTRYLSSYWATSGVRVNAVTPGGVYSGQNCTFVERYSARVPMQRMAHRDEIAGAVVYLASRAASYVTGQNIVVDGGLSAW